MPATAVQHFDDLADRAAEAVGFLKLIANEKRLLLLCHLAGREEATVSDLAAFVGLGQSPVSQHLALLRQEGLVACRRDGLTMRYRIADPMTETVLATLKNLFCPPTKGKSE